MKHVLLISCIILFACTSGSSQVKLTLDNTKSISVMAGGGIAFTDNGRNLFHEGSNMSVGMIYRTRRHGIGFESEWTCNNHYKHIGEQVGLEQLSFLVSYTNYIVDFTSKKERMNTILFAGLSASLEYQSESFFMDGQPYYNSVFIDSDVTGVFPGFGVFIGANLKPQQDQEGKRKEADFGEEVKSVSSKKEGNKYSFDVFTEFVFIPNGQRISDAEWDNYTPDLQHDPSTFVFGNIRWVTGIRINFEWVRHQNRPMIMNKR